tara:strand:- start:19165 stop:19419 length:255 start_codon:yes stop_codon:yes gene_type:complete
MSKSENKLDLKNMSFEKALDELEKIVEKLESGETDLDGSIDAYERGILLKKHCEDKLKQAELRVKKIEARADGIVEKVVDLDSD